MGAADTTPLSRDSLRRALFSDEPYGPIPRDPDDGYIRTITPGSAEGRLTGGCLTLVASTLGTPIEIDTRGRILFLEDLDMYTYTFDNLLTHLRNAGKLQAAAGIVVGEMKGVGWREDHSAFMQELSVEDVLEDLVAPLGVPCIYAHAVLDPDAGTLIVDEVVTAD